MYAQICYDMEWTSAQGDLQKVGCAHKLPSNIITMANQTQTTVENVTVISTPSDFLRNLGPTFTNTLEKWESRDSWRLCDEYTVPDTEGNRRCKQEAIGTLMDRDIPTLQQLHAVQKVCPDLQRVHDIGMYECFRALNLA